MVCVVFGETVGLLTVRVASLRRVRLLPLILSLLYLFLKFLKIFDFPVDCQTASLDDTFYQFLHGKNQSSKKIICLVTTNINNHFSARPVGYEPPKV